MTVRKPEENMKCQILRALLVLWMLKRIATAEDQKSTALSLGDGITKKAKPYFTTGTTQFINNFIYPGTRVEKLRRQKIYPPSYPFPCKNTTWFGRSQKKPTSVHELRPGDIDVVGAMGDSLVAGNGALEEYAIGTVIEYRGVSWCAGGEGTWRQYLTLPNILKEYNPKLKGFSTGKGEFLSKNSGMNVAFPVSSDADALMQAKYLVRKMRSDQQIDFRNDWKVWYQSHTPGMVSLGSHETTRTVKSVVTIFKSINMITLFFGANNLCSAQCFNKEGTSAIEHRNKLMEALDYLQANLPRTFVNLIPVLDVSVSVRQKRSMMCRFLHRFFCMCFHTGRDVRDEYDIITQLVRDYQDAEEQLINSGRYDTKNDFTVVLQPFMKAFNAPREESAKFKPFIDESYITYDCFHFSQKGHALGANMLWNNLLEPVGGKSMKKLDYVMEKFRCPTPKAPFFFTKRNTKPYLKTGSQLPSNHSGLSISRRKDYLQLTAEYINSELGFA